jgi:hypothetical protein
MSKTTATNTTFVSYLLRKTAQVVYYGHAMADKEIMALQTMKH